MRSTLLAFCLLTPALASASSNIDNIEILNWYPDCEYEVLDTVREGYKYKALKGYLDSPAAEEATQKIFHKIKTQAAKVNADSVILTRKSVAYDSSWNSASKVKVRLFFKAELIKNCQVGENSFTKVTPYNDKGNRNVLMGTSVQRSKSHRLVIKPNDLEENVVPEVLETDVSLESGVYGLKLGLNREDVIGAWGQPTITLSLSEKDQILSYGRRHWLYFHNNTLQKIEYGSSWLGVHFLNGLYYSSYFDEKAWTVLGEYSLKTKMADVDTEVTGLESTGVLQRVVRDNDQELVLNFHRVRNFDTDEIEPLMKGFALQNKDYQEPPNLQATKPKLIADYFSQDNETIKANAIMHIRLTGGREAVVMDNHTYIQLAKTSIYKIMAFENIFQEGRAEPESSWQFSPQIFQGLTVTDLQSKFGEDAIVSSYDVSLINEDYRMVLATDPEHENPFVYEAEIWVN